MIVFIPQPAINSNMTEAGAVGMLIIYGVGFTVIFGYCFWVCICDRLDDARRRKKQQEVEAQINKTQESHKGSITYHTGWTEYK